MLTKEDLRSAPLEERTAAGMKCVKKTTYVADAAGMWIGIGRRRVAG
ncbi:MAG: hypothetical protein QXO30_01945 [Candidatus Caldarchaeum sp.]